MKIAIISTTREEAIKLIVDKSIPREKAVIITQEKDALGYDFERVYFTYNAHENPLFWKLLELVEDVLNAYRKRTFTVVNIEWTPKEQYYRDDEVMAIHLDNQDLNIGDLITRHPFTESKILQIETKELCASSCRYLVTLPGKQEGFEMGDLSIGDRMMLVGAIHGRPEAKDKVGSISGF